MARQRDTIPFAVSIVMVALLTGCGSYSLRGRVIEGGNSMILFVPDGDETLEYGRPISGVTVSLTRDPDQLNREVVAESTSGPNGWFDMPVGAFGAGWMDESWDVTARAVGFQGAEQRLRLPGEGDGMVMLIILAEGMDAGTQDENLMEQFERFR